MDANRLSGGTSDLWDPTPSAPQLQQVIWRRWPTLQWTTPTRVVVSETHHRVKQRQRVA
ncbi:hypothetical protein L3X07_03270 [Levilactobacillus brevis]|nr:hypothetical protein [Levilactobacillus brevis]